MPPLKSISVTPTRRGGGRKQPSPTVDDDAESLPLQVALSRSPRRVVAQPTHRYHVGENVRMTGGGQSVQRAASGCKIVFLLPYEGHGALLYRVRSVTESFECIVAEGDLTR